MTPPPRRRDAAASRQRLLMAAGELFAEHGFARTTARDIGERAGVDPAMIARYFGGKTQLYIAVLRAEAGPEAPADLLSPGRLQEMLERVDRYGAGPIFQAAIQPYDEPAAQTATSDELYQRVIDPLRERLAADGYPEPELRAEILTAAIGGIILARRSGTLTSLAGVEIDRLIRVLQPLLDASSRPSEH